MLYGFVYGLYHPITEELRYIGQTQGTLSRRLSGHLCTARRRARKAHVVNWLLSLMNEGLKPLIRVLAPASSQEKLDKLEALFIADARARGESLTNHDDGGRGAPGRKLSDAHKAKLHSAEVHARISETRKGQPSPRKGVVLSPETRAKISLGKRGNRCRYLANVSTEEMKRLRAEGLPFHKIGEILGVSKTTVTKRLAKEVT